MTQPSPQNLDQQLRDAARDRRATLDRLAPAYPVSDYPPRSAPPRSAASGSGVWMRVVWLLGLGGATTAGLLGLVTLISLIVTPDPNRGRLITAETNPPSVSETAIPSVYTLAASLGQLESRMEQRLAPSVHLATAWPSRIQSLPDALLEADKELQKPLRQEFTAIQTDLRTAARYVRQRWRAQPDPTPTGAVPGAVPYPQSAAVTG